MGLPVNVANVIFLDSESAAIAWPLIASSLKN
jgi:hypothetical protein